MENSKNEKVSVITVTLGSKGDTMPEEKYRTEILEEIVRKFGKEGGIILFPAGFYHIPDLGSKKEDGIINNVVNLLKETESESVVCLGIDAGEGKIIGKPSVKNETGHNDDRIAVAINSSGVVAKGFEFMPTKERKNKTNPAEFFHGKKAGYDRFFEHKGKRFYLAVCYDSLSIRKYKIEKPEIDVVLNLVHYFTRSKKGHGYSNFIRYGFGGASRYWKCPVFGSTVFLDRENVPDEWQPVFRCSDKVQNLPNIKNEDNLLTHDELYHGISTEHENAVCHLYSI
jgi:hypothetical protein